MRRSSYCGGYSLVEMMFALVLVVLVQALATPAVSGIINSSRVNNGAEAIFNSLLLARSEAVKRNGKVVVCKSATGDGCSLSGDWQQGWIVFHDANNNATLDPGETILHREAGLSSQVHISGNGPVKDYVSYGPHGKTNLISGAFQAGTITACVQTAKQIPVRQVVINNSGRPRLARTMLDACP
jgi:type IV fimbrial biogenesis protein FimT